MGIFKRTVSFTPVLTSHMFGHVLKLVLGEPDNDDKKLAMLWGAASFSIEIILETWAGECIQQEEDRGLCPKRN
jgi:hypothetical protein